MVILDTDVLTHIQRRRGPEFARLVRRLNAIDDEVVVTIITFEEQVRGWLTYIGRAKTDEIEGYAHLNALLEDFQTRTSPLRRERCGRVRIFVFLSLPVGCLVMFSGGNPVVFQNHKELPIPDGSYWDRRMNSQ